MWPLSSLSHSLGQLSTHYFLAFLRRCLSTAEDLAPIVLGVVSRLWSMPAQASVSPLLAGTIKRVKRRRVWVGNEPYASVLGRR